jgi:RNA polymerase sigma-70 factor (ECF subfamily)
MVSRDIMAVAGSRPATSSASESADVLYSRYVDDVARWVGQLVGPRADVEDLIHDVFVIAIPRWPEFRGDARPTTWLYRITLNVVRNHRRRLRLRRWLALDDQQEPIALDPGPEDQLIAVRRRALVYRALDRLPERQRTILILFELDGRPGPEIAELLGMRIGAVWVALHRARQRFAAEAAALSKGGVHE